MQLKLDKYLIELRKNANRFERLDINGNEDKNFLTRNFSIILCLTISMTFLYLLKKGFSSDFVSYVSSVLSILIGLFISALIFSFDKFHKYLAKETNLYEVNITKNNDEGYNKEYKILLKNVTQQNSKEKLFNIQSFNYAKQFAYLIGYSIILSIFTIVLLSFSTLFDSTMAVNIYEYQFKPLTMESFLVFVINTFIVLQRILVIYWIGRVVYFTMFAVSSMVNFMTEKLNRENDTN